MNASDAMPFRSVLPLPAFVTHPLTSVVIAVVHIYLGAGHLAELFGGDVQWTHVWKGFGAMAGAYVFAALASRGLPLREGQHLCLNPDWMRPRPRKGADAFETAYDPSKAATTNQDQLTG